MRTPSKFISYDSVDDYLLSLNETTLNEYRDEIIRLDKEGLPVVASKRCLAVLFGVSFHFINSILNNPRKYYREFTIKKGKKTRKIQAPKVAIKIIQKWFSEIISEKITFSDNVYGFVKGRSFLQAAKVHCNAKWVYSIDIKDFFNTTREAEVAIALREIGYNDKSTEIITRICCLNGVLPQGSPASPILSNMVFKNTDIELSNLAKKYDIRYTRYADDIVFSGEKEFPIEIKEIAKNIIISHGWVTSEKKEHLSIFPNRLKVHSLLVHRETPRITKGYRNRIRAYKHLLNNKKIKKEDENKVKGHIMYSDYLENLFAS